LGEKGDRSKEAILKEIHSELERFGLGLKRYKPDYHGIGFSALADVLGEKGEYKVILTRPPARELSYLKLWEEAIQELEKKLEKKGIKLDVW